MREWHLRFRTAWLWVCLIAILAGLLTTPAIAERQGAALVVGIDNGDRGNTCSQAALDVATRLNEQSIDTQQVTNPTIVQLRSAIDDFVAGLSGTLTRSAVVYVCAPVMVDGPRLFILPFDADPQHAPDPVVQGVILQAFLKALDGIDGAVFADLGLTQQSGAKEALQTQVERAPPGLHLAINLARRDCGAPIGRNLASKQLSLGQDWNAIAPAVTAGEAPECDFFRKPVPTAAATVAAQASPAVPATPPPQSTSPTPTMAEPASPAPTHEPPPPQSPLEPAAPAPSTLPPTPTDRSTNSSNSASTNPVVRAPASPLYRTPTGTAQAKPSTESPEIETQKFQQSPDARIARLQAALSKRNFYHGPIDGLANVATQQSVRAMQRSLHAPETGVLTQAEIIWLLNR